MMRQHLKQMKNEKGMTLVELLAVLVILGIIAAIAIVMIGNVIEKSRDKANANEALSIINAAKMAYSNSEYGQGSNAKNYDPNTATTFTYKMEDLTAYLDSTKNNGFTVTFTKANGEWKISGHPGVKAVGQTTEATEQQLKDFVD